MNTLWLNIRIIFWHLQIDKGRLFRLQISFNPWHIRWGTLLKPIWIYEFSPKIGWAERNSKQYIVYTNAQRN